MRKKTKMILKVKIPFIHLDHCHGGIWIYLGLLGLLLLEASYAYAIMNEFSRYIWVALLMLMLSWMNFLDIYGLPF